jgi:hypothetical protein
MVSDFVKQIIFEEEKNFNIEKKISDIHKTIKSKIPDGISDNLTKNITDDITDLRHGTVPSMPWMSFSLINDGPNSVNVVINEKTMEKAPVRKGEILDADFLAKDKIERIWIYCEKGQTASVRIYALK